MSNNKILPFDYLKGDDFTSNLKRVTNCKDFQELGELLDVPKSTFSTWNTHNRTSHELMVRLSLSLGIPLEELALPVTERPKLKVVCEGNTEKEFFRAALSQQEVETIDSYCLSNGKLIETGLVPYPVRRFNSFALNPKNTIELETNEAIYLVDKNDRDAVSGNYLIDVDGRLSINQIQRLPGKKLAIAFGDNTMEVAEQDIGVIGRIAVTLKKD
ncbi:phage repressor protein CI [Vibrio parahaemolyticus]|uniref:phage repressor protein CI n=1 Tax=Vibrio parahaemolyticus TaxID=670 RepID=UPI002405BE8C|nr:phage repressor protein CI [Vibrio parahaemolyticus]